MNEPKNYALIEDGLIINIIWLNPENETEFPNAVCCDGLGVSIGNSYIDGQFIIPTPVEEIINGSEDLSVN